MRNEGGGAWNRLDVNADGAQNFAIESADSEETGDNSTMINMVSMTRQREVTTDTPDSELHRTQQGQAISARKVYHLPAQAFLSTDLGEVIWVRLQCQNSFLDPLSVDFQLQPPSGEQAGARI
ncbi:hypothetical protein SCP_0603030 [Sparassis crispa]|uniref:Uncharacterized protein n=1 Tax=Sparassis crispa TaxID=139825 RepID=A0A401GQ12_9APHY|nr:hypothetical protein SCP_0603030 [Sparassis crispa]GBE84325.1 hypothetical protein SCP_0603030 [Sparassis crispa]